MNRTKVEWAKNPDGSQGYSWNPITGCLNGCPYCYARKLANGRLKSRFLANRNLPSDDGSNHEKHLANPFYPRFWPERLKELPKEKNKAGAIRRKKSKPKGIFTCNMCDFFGDWVPAKWQSEVLKVIRANPQHRFYFLTKIPWNVGKWSPLPDNCWIGATVCDKRSAQFATVHYFNVVSAKLKYLSFEPLLEDVMSRPQPWFVPTMFRDADWIIIGSQTKPYNPPKIEWVEAIVEAADKAGKPVFLKNNLKPLLGDTLRQEMPVG